jgi:hypothetical protein
MSRIWKRFLFKVAKGVAVISYVLGSMFVGGFIAGWLGYDPEAGIMAGAFVMVIFPIIAFLLRDIYQDAKREVEWENRKMMDTLKGGKIDY